MRRSLLNVSAAVFAALVGPLGCGGPPPAPTVPTPATAAPTPVATEPGVAAPDLAPAPEPADIVGTLRWKNPMATFTSAGQGAGAPQQVIEAGARAAVEGALEGAMRGMVNAHDLAPLVALDAPVDAVATLDPNPKKRDVITALSIGLTSLDGAKHAAESAAPLVEIAPSIWKIGSREQFEGACAIAAAVGPAPARLICGRKDKDLVALGPYLARTLPTSPSANADLHAEIRFVPVDQRYGDMLRQLLQQAPLLAQSQVAIGEPGFDRAIVEGATGLADELGADVADLDKVTLDLTSGAAQGLSVQGSLVLRNKTSWVAGTVLERPERAGPPPSIFWRVPKDSDAAFWGRGTDPSRYSAILRVLRTLAEGALTKAKIGSAADRKALTDLIQLPLGKDTATVQASGHLDDVKPGPKPTAQQAFDGVMRPWLGWSVIGIDEGPAGVTKLIKDAVSVYGRASLMTPIKKEMGREAKNLPSVKTVAAPAQLGAGALDVEIKATGLDSPFPHHGPMGGGKAKPETVDFTAHVLLMVDGNRTWLAIGMNRDELVKRLLQVKTGAPDAGTLSARAGLEPLKSGSIMSGGFVTLVPILKAVNSSVDWIAPITGGVVPPQVTKVLNVLHTLPNQGQTPIFMTTQQSGAPPMHADVTLALPKGAIDDFTSLAIGLFQLKGQFR